MDRIINTKTEQQSIYEIYRACRLCGAGAGYKMPIIQNVVDLDTSGIELRQKIRDCVQIEVHPDDKMPPLICELCVDKVNDFYEFVELCQRTNKRTRMRLGLPPQTFSRVANSDHSSGSGDCILGVTEQVYQNDDSDEPLTPVTRRTKQNGGKLKVIKKENSKQCHKENSKQKRAPTPPRATRHSKPHEDTMSLSSLKQQGKKSTSRTATPPQPKSILKKEKIEDSPVPTRSKRPREPVKPEVPQKKVKLAVSTASSKTSPSPKSYKPGPRSRRASVPPPPRARRAPSPPPPPPPPAAPAHPCRICGKLNSTSQALGNHLRSHTVQFTSPKLACDACQVWFASSDEALAHHRRHRDRRKPYRCGRCAARHDTYALYTRHIDNSECIPWAVTPDVKCEECWQMFPTTTSVRNHACGGAGARPGGKCKNCRRAYTLLKNLKKHEATCTTKAKGTLIVDPEVQSRIKPAQVRVARCDALLTRVKQEHYDVADVAQNYGLDRNCIYPYISTCVKSELPCDSMVNIKAELDDYEVEDFVHWDSDTDTDDEAKKTVASLSTLTLKKLFSKKCLGKVPRKRRKLNLEKNVFDSLLNASEFDNTMSRDINNIIDNLGNDEDDQNGSDEESLLTNYVLFDNATTNNDKCNDVEDSNDSQSILDIAGSSNDVNNETSISNTNDNNTELDKDSSLGEKETNTVNETMNEIVQENNEESGTSRTDTSNVDSANTSNDTETRDSHNENDNNERENSANTINDNRTESREDLSIKNGADSKINDNNKKESSYNDNFNENNDSTAMDCTEDVSMLEWMLDDSSRNKVANVNTSEENNTIDNKEIVANNGSENPKNDSENTKNDNEKTQNARSEKLNGEIEQSDKYSFGVINDVCGTEVSDENVMDELNEHNNIKDVNSDQVIEDKNESGINGAKIDLSNSCDNTNHTTNSNDYENAINDLISENNVTKNNDIAKNNDTLSNVSQINDCENRVSYCETDKISLEDLLPPNSGGKSMELDSISDEDFDFDAC